MKMGQVIITEFDTRLKVRGENAAAIKTLLDKKMTKDCSKVYSSAIESILMEYINSKKQTK